MSVAALLATGANILSKMESKNKNEENLSDLTKRFLNEVERMGVTFYNIAKNTGVKEAMFTKIKRGTQEPSKKFLSKFAECFPDANMEYIYLGKEDKNNEDDKIISDVTRRFIETYKNMGLTGYRMGKDCNSITKQKISNIENGLTEASIDMVSDFCDVYSNVNANYILTGKGSMFLEEENGNEKRIEYDTSHILTYDELVRQHDATIANYETLIKQMKEKFSEIENSVYEMKELFKKVGA